MLMHLENEATLVAQAQAGSEDSFERLYNQYSRHVYRQALNLVHDDQEADDVLQDTFLKAFVHLRDFRGESRFSTWLTRIAVNEALARLRRRAAHKQDSLDTPIEGEEEQSSPREIRSREDDVEEAYSKLELQAILSKVIGTLEPASRTIIALRYEQEVSTEAAARQLGLSVPAAKARLLRARLRMRKGLKKFVGRDSVLAGK